MLNKKIKPLISLPAPEGLSYAERIMLQKSEEMNKNIPIIVIPEEAKDLRNEVQSLADENGIDISIIEEGMSRGKNSRLLSTIAAMSLTLALTEQQKKDRIVVIDGEEYSEEKGNLSTLTNPYFITDAVPTIATQGNFYNPIFKDKDFSKPKKERVKNNRKTKKRKKAKNGR